MTPTDAQVRIWNELVRRYPELLDADVVEAFIARLSEENAGIDPQDLATGRVRPRMTASEIAPVFIAQYRLKRLDLALNRMSPETRAMLVRCFIAVAQALEDRPPATETIQ